MIRSKPDKPQCGSQCRLCTVDQDGQTAYSLQGWRLVLPAAAVFLGPLLLAVLGAALAGASHSRQAIGAATGLAVGAAAAIAVSKAICKKVPRSGGSTSGS